MDKEKVMNNVDEEENVSLPEEDELFESAEMLDKLEVLREAYPDVDIEALAEDEMFLTFAKDKGDDYLAIFEDYKHLESEMYRRAEQKYRAKLERTTSVGARKKPSNFGLTAAQVELLTEWNRENPEYSFSPREYSFAVKR